MHSSMQTVAMSLAPTLLPVKEVPASMHAWLDVYGRQAGSMPWITTTLSHPSPVMIQPGRAGERTLLSYPEHKSEKGTFRSVIMTCPSHTLATPHNTPATANKWGLNANYHKITIHRRRALDGSALIRIMQPNPLGSALFHRFPYVKVCLCPGTAVHPAINCIQPSTDPTANSNSSSLSS
jgi:hypothetical protein